MITSTFYRFLKSENFPAAGSYLRQYGHLLAEGQLLELRVRLLIKQGLFGNALKILNEAQPLIGVNPGLNAVSLTYCQLFKLQLEGLIHQNIKPSLEDAHSIFEKLEQNDSPLRGFAAETMANLYLMAAKLKLMPSEVQTEGLVWLKRAISLYKAFSLNEEYFSSKLTFIKEKNDTALDSAQAYNAALEALINEARSLNDSLIEVTVTLACMRSKLSLMDDPHLLGGLKKTLRLIPHFGGQAQLYLLRAKQAFMAGSDGRAYAKKAVYLYHKIEHYRGLWEAWMEHNTQCLHFSDLHLAKGGYQISRRIAQSTGIRLNEALALMALGETAHRMGKYGLSLQYYESAENLVKGTALAPLLGLNLANIYDQMNLKNKALDLAMSTVEDMKSKGAAPQQLSLAYFITGNILVSGRRWSEAIQIWQDGLKFDQENGLFKGISEKSSHLGWTYAQQAHQRHGTIPDEDFSQIEHYFQYALEVIKTAEADQERIVTAAQSYQNFAHCAILAKKYMQAFSLLDELHGLYENHNLGMQAANTMALKGLTAFQLGKTNDFNYRQIAEDAYLTSLKYFEQHSMKNFSWRIKYYLADLYVQKGIYSRSTQLTDWQQALTYLQRSHEDIRMVRREFQQDSVIRTDAGKLGLVSDKSKVYQLGIGFSLVYLKDTSTALYWLEQLKSRALADMLQQADDTLDTSFTRLLNDPAEDEVDSMVMWSNLKRQLSG